MLSDASNKKDEGTCFEAGGFVCVLFPVAFPVASMSLVSGVYRWSLTRVSSFLLRRTHVVYVASTIEWWVWALWASSLVLSLPVFRLLLFAFSSLDLYLAFFVIFSFV